MTMYLHRVGAASNPKRHTWEPPACALYAVAVGAGVDDIAFTVDTYGGRDQLVYPTFVLSGVLAAESMSWPDPGFQTGDYDPHELVLGEQARFDDDHRSRDSQRDQADRPAGAYACGDQHGERGDRENHRRAEIGLQHDQRKG